MPVGCDLTQGIGRACKNSIGGQANLYLFNSDENPWTIVDGEATAIDPAVTVVYKYELEGDGNTLVQNMVSDRNTGTTVNTQTLTTVLKKTDATKSAELNLLAYGFPMAVVEDRNGEFHALAVDDGMDFTIDEATGGAKTDLNGYTLTGVATTGALAPKLDAATITAFLALVS